MEEDGLDAREDEAGAGARALYPVGETTGFCVSWRRRAECGGGRIPVEVRSRAEAGT